jgi:hypothetical protein
MNNENLLAQINPLEQKRINAAKALGWEFAGKDWHYCDQWMDMNGAPSYAELLEKLSENQIAEIDRLKEALVNARGWITANTTKPVHDLLRTIDSALGRPT